MKKKLILFAAIPLLLSGCNSKPEPTSAPTSAPAPTSEATSAPTSAVPTSEITSSSSETSSATSTQTTTQPEKQNFENVFFDDLSVSYDGSSHILSEVRGAPAGTSISYSGRDAHTNVGSYPASATLTKEGYNTKVLNAILTITKGTISGITFESQTFEYDGREHSISITGSLPSTATVTYSSDVQGVTNTAVEIGEYNIAATISDSNYNTLVLHATLKITTNDDERYLKWSGDTLFFQNALHDNYLYAYNSTNDKLVRTSRDNAVDMIEYQDDSIMFVSKSLLGSSIKTAAYDEATQKVNLSTIHGGNVRYVQYGGGDIVYYVSNSLKNSDSGIYKADLSGEEAVVTCLSVGKAKFLTLVGNYLYFADGANGYKFSRISISGTNQSRQLVVDEKIKNLYYENSYFYYTVDRSLGDYIERYSLNSGRRKITSDAGIDFCFIDGYIYYINIDKLTSSIWGKGIYKVNENPLTDNNLPGSPVIRNDKGLCSLASDGEHLYYYDMNGYKLIEAETDGDFVSDILDGFVKPEDPTPLSLGGDMAEYGGNLYYLDIWDDKTLHSYNPQTKLNVRLTSDKVDNFSIIGDYVYCNIVTKLVNNDVYRFNLKTSMEPELVSKKDGSDFISDGTYLYFAEGGTGRSIQKVDLSTMTEETIYEHGVSNLRMVNGKLCFIDGYQIYSMNLSTKEVTELKPNNKSVHTTAFDTNGTEIYYREMYSVAYALKRLSRFNPVTSEYTILVEADTDPISIVYNKGYVYYYTDTTKADKNGLYKVPANVASETTPECVLKCNSTYYAETFTFVGNNLYFTNYISAGLFGDSHIYELVNGSSTPTKVC